MKPEPTDVTLLLSELEKGNQEAASKLVPLVYDELQRIADHYMHLERQDHTLLAKLGPRQVRIVELRFFGGMTVEETADIVGISPRQVKREWSFARAWLHGELESSRYGDLAGELGSR
jgi:RNA polymerase sigma factor (sigma-70 family)